MSAHDTKTRILDATQHMMQQRGANAVSFKHISDAVGLCKASILHHFPSKEELLEAVLQRHNACFLAVFYRIIDSNLDAPGKLKRGMALFQATLREGDHAKACLCGMLGAELTSLGAASVKLVREFFGEMEQRLARILQQGLDEGTFRFSGNVRAAAALVFSLLEGGVLIVRAKGGEKQWKSISSQLLKMLGTV